MWNWHYSGWGWWLVMSVGMLAFWAMVVWVAIVLARGNGPKQADADALLDQRLARGEIDVDEYRRRLDALHHSHSGDRAV